MKSPASAGEEGRSDKSSIRGKPSRTRFKLGLFTLTALLSLLLFYFGILPTVLKQKLEDGFSSRPFREAVIRSLTIHPYGLKLSGTICDFRKKAVLEVDEAKLKFDLPTVLKGKPRLTEIVINGFSLSLPNTSIKPVKDELLLSIPIIAENGEISFRSPNLNQSFDVAALSLIPSGYEKEMLCKARGRFSIQNSSLLQALKGYAKLDLTINKKEISGNLSLRDTSIKIERFPASIDGIKGNINLSEGKISADNLFGNFCDGELLFSFKFDPNKAPPTYAFSCALEQANLIEILPALASSPRDIYGKLQAGLSITGTGASQESILGRGNIKITEGNLYEISFLRGLAGLLLVPSLKKITFDAASCDFELDGKGLRTKNLKLTGDNTGIMIEGLVRYDGSLDLTATTAFTEQLLMNVPEFKKIASAFLHTMDFFLIRHSIQGTIEKPKHKPVPLPIIMHLPIQVLKKILKALF